MEDLCRRGAELPVELEHMFELMLSRIDERYRKEGAYILHVCMTFQRPASSRLLPHAAVELQGLPLAILALGGDDQYRVEYFRRMTVSHKRELCEGLAGWLASRCGGLLVFIAASRHGAVCFCSPRSDEDNNETENVHDPHTDGKVEWMHKCVFDYLDINEASAFEGLQSPDRRPGVTAALSLYGLYTATLARHGENSAEAAFYFYSIFMGAKADAEEPTSRRNSFWQIHLLLHGLRTQRARATGLAKLCRLLMGHEDHAQGLLHIALLLASELGTVNFMVAQPGLVSFAQQSGCECDCRSILYHAVVRLLLSVIMAKARFEFPSIPSRPVVFSLPTAACPPSPVF